MPPPLREGDMDAMDSGDESDHDLVYLPSTRKIISSYDVVIDESLSSALAYMSQPYSDEMAMRPSVTYTPCDTSLREQTGNIIVFTYFEEINI